MSRQQQPPRAKCDQVVYEAIAKAAEIIVRGRCQVPSAPPNHSHTSTSPHRKSTGMAPSLGSSSIYNVHGNTRHGSNVGVSSRRSSGSGSSSGGASSRFNLHIEEVDSVRSILQLWKKSLHVPLRLDVYYQYCTSPQDSTPKKELLERWCIDYLSSEQSTPSAVSSSSSSSYPNNNMHGNRMNTSVMDDTISQLRQVCKRVVIFLRTLYSLTRMMPAYRLHHALTEDESHVEGGGPGLGGGYYHSNPALQRQTTPQAGMLQKQILDQIGGQILFSFYVSDTGGGGGPSLAPDAALFSSSSNTPFARHDLSPIPTPFGLLHLSALYDSTLAVEKVLLDRAYRLAQCKEAQQQGQVGVTRAIPIHRTSVEKELPTQQSQTQGEQVLPKSAPTNNGMMSKIAPRRDSDPIAPRVLSGLSLALMENETNESNTPDEEASLRQRRALHHPPPFLADQQNPYYGYAYNSGKVGTPSTTTPMPISTSSNSTTPQMGSSPKPSNSWTNTPPQPVFIGSLPRGGAAGTPGTGTSKGGGLVSPPFQNPLSLQQAPSFGSSVKVDGQSFKPSNTTTEKDLILPPVTAADTLEPSPFHSIGLLDESSSSSPFLAAYVSTAALNSSQLNSDSLKYDPSTAQHDDAVEDMPFVVDMEVPQQPSGSFAHQLASGGRLKLFSTTEALNNKNTKVSSSATTTNDDESISSLTNQLDSFRSFGESFMTAGSLIPPSVR